MINTAALETNMDISRTVALVAQRYAIPERFISISGLVGRLGLAIERSEARRAA